MLNELWDEFRQVVLGQGKVLDTVLPPLLFVGVNWAFGFTAAMWSALGLALLLTAVRLWRGQPIWYALGGVGGVVLAILIARFSDRNEGFFLPTIVTSGATAVLAVISVLAKRPLVAWTSFITRRWPLAWYWHDRVRPAYSEITWLWAIFFGTRALLQGILFYNEQEDLLALLNLLSGWPAIVALLVITYLYGIWRLQNLGGPSVAEFKEGAPPPWEGQKKGF